MQREHPTTRPAPDRPKVLFLLGCTASGKSALAGRLAVELDTDILSVDSMKVYRHMDIGTAKPTADQRRQVTYHLIDVVDPSEAFSAARFVDAAQTVIADLHGRSKLIIAEGGTALYLKALAEGLFDAPPSDPDLRGELKSLGQSQGGEFLHRKLQHIDPDAAGRIHRNDLRRIIRALEVHELTGQPITALQRQFGQLRTDYDMRFLGLTHEKDGLNRRINARVKHMIDQGLVDEVKRLHHRTPPLCDPARQALGYAEIIRHLEHEYDLETAVEKIKINTRRFAKSQRTWFRRMPHIQWFPVPPDTDPLDLLPSITKYLAPWLSADSR